MPDKHKPSDTSSCFGCPASCCRYVAVQIDRPTTKRDYDNIRWMLHHDMTEVYIDNEGDWVMQVNVPCSKLDLAHHRCRIYKNRPLICQELEVSECERDGHEGEVHFYEAADLDKWLKSKKRKKRK